MIRALIVDDEAPARREMRRLLGVHADVQVVAEAADVEAAAAALQREEVDVVFLDIRLGRGSGFDLLPALDPDVAVVFVTAYEDYARQAFDAQALDYLLKPVDPQRLAATLRRLADRPATIDTGVGFASRAWLFLDDRDRPEFVRVDSISHILADGDRSILVTADGRRRSTAKSLAHWESRLPGEDFIRTHRSAIVNLRHVDRLEPWFHYSFRIHMRGSTEPVPLSRRRAGELRQALG
jgi:two-component system LytT family response regulator